MEKGAALAEKVADDGHIEVVARGNKGQRDAEAVKQKTEHEVVYVALVAGEKDKRDFLALSLDCRLLDARKLLLIHKDALVKQAHQNIADHVHHEAGRAARAQIARHPVEHRRGITLKRALRLAAVPRAACIRGDGARNAIRRHDITLDAVREIRLENAGANVVLVAAPPNALVEPRGARGKAPQLGHARVILLGIVQFTRVGQRHGMRWASARRTTPQYETSGCAWHSSAPYHPALDTHTSAVWLAHSSRSVAAAASLSL